MKKYVAIGRGAVAGFAIGHFLIKKGNLLTYGLAVAGAAAGWYLTRNESTSNMTAAQYRHCIAQPNQASYNHCMAQANQ